MTRPNKPDAPSKAVGTDPAAIAAAQENVTLNASSQSEPSAAHQPFSWLDTRLGSDHQAQFVALTMDVSSGIETCLQLLHSDMLTRNANQWADPGQEIAAIFEKHHGERLLLLATAAARMLSERAEASIEAMNDRASSAAEGRAS